MRVAAKAKARAAGATMSTRRRSARQSIPPWQRSSSLRRLVKCLKRRWQQKACPPTHRNQHQRKQPVVGLPLRQRPKPAGTNLVGASPPHGASPLLLGGHLPRDGAAAVVEREVAKAQVVVKAEVVVKVEVVVKD